MPEPSLFSPCFILFVCVSNVYQFCFTFMGKFTLELQWQTFILLPRLVFKVMPVPSVLVLEVITLSV